MVARVGGGEGEFAAAGAFLMHDAVVVVEFFVDCYVDALQSLIVRDELMRRECLENGVPFQGYLRNHAIGRSIVLLYSVLNRFCQLYDLPVVILSDFIPTTSVSLGNSS